jgi:hypothetical protein
MFTRKFFPPRVMRHPLTIKNAIRASGDGRYPPDKVLFRAHRLVLPHQTRRDLQGVFASTLLVPIRVQREDVTTIQTVARS